MKRLFILTTFLLGISPICLNAQELTLEECQQQARAHYPLIKRYGLIEKTKEYNISNADKGYLHSFIVRQSQLSIGCNGNTR